MWAYKLVYDCWVLAMRGNAGAWWWWVGGAWWRWWDPWREKLFSTPGVAVLGEPRFWGLLLDPWLELLLVGEMRWPPRGVVLPLLWCEGRSAFISCNCCKE